MTAYEDRPRSKVLVALNGSPASATALPLGRVLAKQLNAAVEILHVAAGDAPDEELWRHLHLDLEAAESVQIRSHAGEPAAAILQAAGAPEIELVILATHGRKLEHGRELGRVAQAVIAHTTRPIVLVRPEAAPPVEAPAPLRRLLLPLDGTPSTAAALRPATDLACRLGASIDVLYVASTGPAGPGEPGSIGAPCYVDQPQHEWPHWAKEVLDRLCACLGDRLTEVPLRMFLTQGDIGGEIARFAAEHAVDAIILVRRSKLNRGRGRVLRAVLEQMSCPALLVGGPAS